MSESGKSSSKVVTTTTTTGDRDRFFQLKNRPKDTFLTKLDHEEVGSEDDSTLFPRPNITLDLWSFFTRLGKIVLFTLLIGGFVVSCVWFHDRIRILEEGLQRLELSCSSNTRDYDLSTGNEFNRIQETKIRDQQILLNRVKRKVDHERHSSRSHFGHSGGGGGSTTHGAHVEFMHPRNKDENIRRDQPGSSSSLDEASFENNSDSVVLASYSKIPLTVIQEFCLKTKDHCPPAPPGPPGPPGQIGLPGVKGETGERGHRGPMGPTGVHGLRGPKGEPGSPGLEGRDGSPGEPGLDGVPGRHGSDGIPGNQGLDGRSGSSGPPGIDGRNGTDGRPGQKGEQGVRGLPGVVGPIGPKGTDGIPGIPGINATVINGINANRTILIPPSIMGSQTKTRPLVVMEGENVRLGCTATGSPPPIVKWTREDGSAIKLGALNLYSGVLGPLLNLTKVNRIHTGRYICHADNGVTPSASKVHELHVNFKPSIIVNNQKPTAEQGKTGRLECEVEAFPRGATSWITAAGKFITSNDTKYQTSTYEYDSYRVRMVLIISKVTKGDFATYECMAKNAYGHVQGKVTLIEWASNKPMPPPELVVPDGTPKTFGNEPPPLVEESPYCPPIQIPKCETCTARIEPVKCIQSGYQLIDKLAWSVKPLGSLALPEDNNRTALGGCQLSQVGKPVFHGEFKHNGSWMRETFLKGSDFDKYYKTRMEQTDVLYEYSNKTTFSNDIVVDAHMGIQPHFQGNFHTIYNSAFYYVAAANTTNPDGELKIVKYSLQQRKNVDEIVLPHSSGNSDPLYAERNPKSNSRVDLAVDENGLWAIYTIPGHNNTIVAKIEVGEKQLEILYGWNITISHKLAGDMFIICGVLYAVDSVNERDTKIRLGLDLYRRKLISRLDLPFTNPFKMTTMVSYYPRSKELLTLDEGNILIYPVKHSALIENDRDYVNQSI